EQYYPSLGLGPTGDFVVAWSTFLTDPDIHAQRYNAAGQPQGGEFPVNTITARYQNNAAVALDAGGNFVIAWQNEVTSGNYEIYAQLFNAAGVAQQGEFQVNTGTWYNQILPAAGMDA